MNHATLAKLSTLLLFGLLVACGGGAGGGENSVNNPPSIPPEETFTVALPGVAGNPDDSITVPNGRPVYAILASGYAVNGDFSELYYYNLAKYLAERNAYVHFSWWNNLLSPYLGRALHARPSGAEPNPGLLKDIWDLPAFIPRSSEYGQKAIPAEDDQFQSDAKALLRAIREHNPTAKIVIVGHSMGGGAVARLGADPDIADIQIDLLAPIDPVGNRSWPAAPRPNAVQISMGNPDPDYNWTRWRATHEEFLGYKAMDCSERNIAGLCTINSVCVPAGPYHNDHSAIGGWNPDWTPLNTCQGPYVHQPRQRRFGANVAYLYHRYQKEALFPFDFAHDYLFGYPAPLVSTNDVADGTNFQQPVTTCGLLDGLDPVVPTIRCRQPDGHGEIVGYRLDSGLDPFNPYPYATLMNGNWPTDRATDSANIRAARRAVREDLVRRLADPQVVAAHAPQYPQLDMVVSDMIRIVQLRFGLPTP